MACISCQERRKAIAKIAARLGGTIVFGARRLLAAPPEKALDDGGGHISPPNSETALSAPRNGKERHSGG